MYLNSDAWIICVPNLQIGDEFDLGKGFVIKAFKTYHVVPSQVQTMQICQDSNNQYKLFLPICFFLPISDHSESQCASNILLWQGYLIYSVKQKLKAEYAGLPGKEIKALKGSGAEVWIN